MAYALCAALAVLLLIRAWRESERTEEALARLEDEVSDDR